MISNACLLKVFLAEAINTACYLINQSPPHLLAIKLQKRYGLVTLLVMLIWEYLVVLLIFFVNDGKLESRVRKAIFLGYGAKRCRL